jgi:hypothetical protein
MKLENSFLYLGKRAEFDDAVFARASLTFTGPEVAQMLNLPHISNTAPPLIRRNGNIQAMDYILPSFPILVAVQDYPSIFFSQERVRM